MPDDSRTHNIARQARAGHVNWPHNIRVHIIAKGISTINYKSTLFGYNRTHSEVSKRERERDSREERGKTGACKVTFIVWALVRLHCILFGVLWFMCRMTRWACAFVYCGFSSDCIIYCLFIFLYFSSLFSGKLLFHCCCLFLLLLATKVFGLRDCSLKINTECEVS